MSSTIENVNVSVKANDPIVVSIPNKDSAIPSTNTKIGFVPASESFDETDNYVEAKHKRANSISPVQVIAEPSIVNPCNVSPIKETIKVTSTSEDSSSDEADIKAESIPSEEASDYDSADYGCT